MKLSTLISLFILPVSLFAQETTDSTKKEIDWTEIRKKEAELLNFGFKIDHTLKIKSSSIGLVFNYPKPNLFSFTINDTSRYEINFHQVRYITNPFNRKSNLSWNLIHANMFFAMIFTEWGPSELYSTKWDFIFLLTGGKYIVPLNKTSNIFIGNNIDTFHFSGTFWYVNTFSLGIGFDFGNNHIRVPFEYHTYARKQERKYQNSISLEYSILFPNTQP